MCLNFTISLLYLECLDWFYTTQNCQNGPMFKFDHFGVNKVTGSNPTKFLQIQEIITNESKISNMGFQNIFAKDIQKVYYLLNVCKIGIGCKLTVHT
jgi:hypothetical protein